VIEISAACLSGDLLDRGKAVSGLDYTSRAQLLQGAADNATNEVLVVNDQERAPAQRSGRSTAHHYVSGPEKTATMRLP
jgi:hypothetical protein